MLESRAVFEAFRAAGVAAFYGVPDSLLKDFCGFVSDELPPEQHVIAANEGAAVALATGRFLGGGGLSCVYLQNSGLGNTVNPLLSIADREVYSVPMLLLIGWRGEPGRKDEPQHVKQGRVTPALLDAMEIPCETLDAGSADFAACIARLADLARAERRPVALLCREGTFAKYKIKTPAAHASDLSREAAIAEIVARLPREARVVATTGKISRELYEHRQREGSGAGRDFLTVGAMGHASQIALGLCFARPDLPVVCLDGDGAALMHLGGFALIGARAPANLLHVVLNNGAHESVGGQPTVALQTDLCGVARACGYPVAVSVADGAGLRAALADAAHGAGLRFIEVRVANGSRADLGRPRSTPLENIDEFMNALP
jgi:phosphonopyruvate decarboxylase